MQEPMMMIPYRWLSTTFTTWALLKVPHAKAGISDAAGWGWGGAADDPASAVEAHRMAEVISKALQNLSEESDAASSTVSLQERQSTAGMHPCCVTSCGMGCSALAHRCQVRKRGRSQNQSVRDVDPPPARLLNAQLKFWKAVTACLRMPQSEAL